MLTLGLASLLGAARPVDVGFRHIRSIALFHVRNAGTLDTPGRQK